MSQNSQLTLEELRDKKASISSTLRELQNKISSFGITKNQKNYKPHTVNTYSLSQKDKYVAEYNNLQKEIIDINLYIRKLSNQDVIFKEVVKSALPDDIYKKLIEETINRANGGEPTKIGVDTESSANLKQRIADLVAVVKEYHDSLFKVRNEITKYIDINCPDDHNGKVTFLKDISVLNTSVNTKDYYLKKRRFLNI